MKKIGVILCSKTKKDNQCSVREMYDDSISFKARRMFMDLAYDEWYVNTSSKGFMNPSMIIEPYDSWYINKTSKNSQLRDNNNVLTNDMIQKWVDLVDSQFPNKDEIELHCHLSLGYYNKLKTIFPNIVYVKPQKNFTSTAWRYYDAIKMYKDGKSLDECLDFIATEYSTKRLKEQPKTFYHVDGREFNGKGYDLSKTYNLDNGCCYGLSMGSIYMTYGWTTDKSLLPFIERRGKHFRITKKMPPIDKSWKRDGLREALNNLNTLLGL